jgi:hypothetical protein
MESKLSPSWVAERTSLVGKQFSDLTLGFSGRECRSLYGQESLSPVIDGEALAICDAEVKCICGLSGAPCCVQRVSIDRDPPVYGVMNMRSCDAIRGCRIRPCGLVADGQ